MKGLDLRREGAGAADTDAIGKSDIIILIIAIAKPFRCAQALAKDKRRCNACIIDLRGENA